MLIFLKEAWLTGQWEIGLTRHTVSVYRHAFQFSRFPKVAIKTYSKFIAYSCRNSQFGGIHHGSSFFDSVSLTRLLFWTRILFIRKSPYKYVKTGDGDMIGYIAICPLY
jgi:hypothetical protein